MNDSTQFGNLVSVPLREASDFTVWLTRTPEQLASLIDISVKLIDSDVDVEEFSAAALARSPTDAARVRYTYSPERLASGQ